MSFNEIVSTVPLIRQDILASFDTTKKSTEVD